MEDELVRQIVVGGLIAADDQTASHKQAVLLLLIKEDLRNCL